MQPAAAAAPMQAAAAAAAPMQAAEWDELGLGAAFFQQAGMLLETSGVDLGALLLPNVTTASTKRRRRQHTAGPRLPIGKVL